MSSNQSLSLKSVVLYNVLVSYLTFFVGLHVIKIRSQILDFNLDAKANISNMVPFLI